MYLSDKIQMMWPYFKFLKLKAGSYQKAFTGSENSEYCSIRYSDWYSYKDKIIFSQISQHLLI